MKRKALTLISLLLIFTLIIGCAPVKNNEDFSKHSFIVNVISVSMNSIEVSDGEQSYVFSIENADKDADIESGDRVEITYYGGLNAENLSAISVKLIEKITADSEAQATEVSTTAPETTEAPQEVKYQDLLDMIDQMSVEEKVGQLFIARCPDETALEDIDTYHLGGYILFGKDFKNDTIESVQAKIQSFQNEAEVPMLIGADEEGGTVLRISRYSQYGASPFPSPAELYNNGGFDLLKSNAKEKAELLKMLGVNINFAPVCDITTDPASFMYDRSLRQDAQTTAEYVKVVVEETLKNNVACMLKHFPGYGNNSDSHTGIVYDDRELDEFISNDFIPFKAGIDVGAPAVLVAHNVINAVDSTKPASISPAVHELLRNELGFDGVIVTDDLSMEGLTDFTDAKTAAVEAVLSGNDLLTCTNYAEQIPYVIAAVKDGTIPLETVEQSVLRILILKRSIGLI